MVGINSIVDSIGWRYRNLKHHRHHNALASVVLDSVATVKGRLPRPLIKLCDEYASDVLGRRHFAPWLYVYSAVSGGFKEGWIPDNYYDTVMLPKFSGAYGDISALKPMNFRIFGSDAFPDLASHVNGLFLDKNFNFIPDEDIKSFLFKQSRKIVFKIDDSEQGIGVFVFTEESFELDKVKQLGNGLFQHFIDQHELFDTFAKGSVATLRITTYVDDNGVVTARACYLRLGAGSDTHVQSKSHIRVAIDLANGQFSDIGYTPNWLETDVHPTSHEQFAAKTIPSFRACVDLVLDLHGKVPFVRCVGWDVTVDARGQPAVMEWNGGHNDIRFGEATQGPCFVGLGWQRYRPTGPDLMKAIF